jgi:serine/threonine protein kinase
MSDVLSYLHTLGLIHRDVKPHNFLISQGNTILLTDLGSVMSMATKADGPMFFEGTIAYAAPEQLEGRASSASDQYAMAVTIYEWFTGTWPFVGSFSEVVEQHYHAAPPPLSHHNIRVSPSLEAVIARALEKEPADRYPNVREFAEAFHKACTEPESTQTTRQFRLPGHFLL